MTHKIEWGGTVGPWIVNSYRAQVDCPVLDKDNDLLPVCRMLWPTKYRSEEETETNARAIAEVPAMVALLRAINSHDSDISIRSRCFAILARLDGAA